MELINSEDEKERYLSRNILRSETIYGQGYQSPGGTEAIEWCCRYVDLSSFNKPMTVLDIGSGLGGTAFYFNDSYGARVIGIDTAEDMIKISLQRKGELGYKDIQFIHGNILTLQLENEMFDLIWSRDVFMYESKKDKTFLKCKSLLKDNGYLIISDFCIGGTASDFDEYIKTASYNLMTLTDYRKTIEEAGLKLITCEDISSHTKDLLLNDLHKFENNKKNFLNNYSENDYKYIINRWNTKIDFINRGLLIEALFIAKKNL